MMTTTTPIPTYSRVEFDAAPEVVVETIVVGTVVTPPPLVTVDTIVDPPEVTVVRTVDATVET